MTYKTHAILVILSLVYLVGQLLTGTNLQVAGLLTGAIVCGLYSIPVGGGLLSAAGLLNALLITHFLLIAVALKIALFEPSDLGLLAPVTTSTVMALGFLGVLIGTWLQRRTPILKWTPIPSINGARMYFSLTLVLIVLGYGGYLVSLRSDLGGEGVQTGGILGIARAFNGFKSFAIVTALYFAWARGGRRFMTHPLTLFVLGLGAVVGVMTTNKQDAMEPFVFYIVVSAFRYGFADKRLWALAAAGVFYYSAIIYPYSQYVRYNGGRQGDLSARIAVMEDVFWQTLTDPEFRKNNSVKVEVSKRSYLGRESLEAFSRLAMVGEADRLISATEEQHAFTGWETIVWGFRLIVPSFIDPDKPVWSTGNLLGHIAGDAGPSDLTTQWAYGIMANLYNAFSYLGVFFGCILFFWFFYYSFRFWFRNPKWSRSPTGTTIWFLLLVTFYQHSLIEDPVAGLVTSMEAPFLILLLFYLGRLTRLFLPSIKAFPALRRLSAPVSIYFGQ